MAENEKTDIKELKTEEQSPHQNPDGILTKKINGKTFVTEIYFDNLLYFMLSHSPRQILIYLSMSLNIMVFFRHFSTARFHTQSPQFPLACITLNSLS